MDVSEIPADFDFSGFGKNIPLNNLASKEAATLTGKTKAELEFSWNNTLITTGATPEAKFERSAARRCSRDCIAG